MVQMRMEGFKKVSEDMERVIEKDDSGSSVAGSEEGKSMPLTCREQLQHILHSTKFQIVIVCLVVFDCILVIAELLIDLEMFEFDKEDSPVPHVLHYMSIGVLSIFLVEICVKLYAFRLEFFKHKLEVFDAFVVITSFALDVAFAGGSESSAAVGLLIILRLWRVARILNGVVISVKAQAERRLQREKALRTATEQELAKYREYCTAQENEIEALQQLLRKHNIEFEKMEKPVMGHKINVVAEVNELSSKLAMQEVDLSNSPA